VSRKLKLVAGLFFHGLTLLAFGQGVGISTGGSYAFEFSSLSFIRTATPADGGQVSINFITDGLGPGENLLLELFPNTLTDTPLAFTFDGATGGPFPDGSLGGIALFWSPGSLAIWPDLQGVVRVTMNSGSIQLSSFSVTQVANGGYHSQTFPVPEPSTMTLILVSVGVFMAMRRQTFDRE
jgi:hypothetical protein